MKGSKLPREDPKHDLYGRPISTDSTPWRVAGDILKNWRW